MITGNAIFGFSFLFSKLALQVTQPTVLIAIRFTVAFALLNLIVLIGRMLRRDGKPLVSFSLRGKPKRDVLLLALFQPVIYFIAENYGIVYTSSAFAGIIIALVPLAGIAMDALILHEKVQRRHILCAVCSVVGVAFTTIGAADMKSSPIGFLLLLIAVAAGSFFYVFSKRAGTHYNALEKTYVMFGCGSVFYLVIALLQCGIQGWEPFAAAIGSPVFWGAILYLAVVSSVGAFLLLNYGTAHVSVSNATLFANVTTVISIFAGVLILHERFTFTQLIGALIILASVTIAQLQPKTNKRS